MGTFDLKLTSLSFFKSKHLDDLECTLHVIVHKFAIFAVIIKMECSKKMWQFDYFSYLASVRLFYVLDRNDFTANVKIAL